MAAIDTMSNFAGGLDTPGNRAVAVSPSNSVDLTYVAKALYIGGAGDVKVTTAGGDAVVFSAVPAGQYVIARIARVWSTGTTATNILALGDW